MKIRPVGAELFHADGRTDTTKLIVVFRSFAKATKITRGPLMVAQWLRYCATNRKVAGSIPDGVIGIFH
jgi:hypothetical protein